jgi:YD repeat-containing protein
VASGKEVVYAYDSLKRLALAQTAKLTNNWSDTYTYDGFGNLTNMAGTGGTWRTGWRR